ncbi:hypothetical protein KC332_g6903 [Hortaea werneckii]|uniref:RING-type domain-containing protein n=1 Tax=Hortaea werneckii EXF-2000 TaxID=1157616 RepID=A0A1Z5SP39_HORWE|nr:hypothetical protein KC358_g6728 [Hortaea werneckii]OTA22612.1 hypothetical protein BTJ68_14671 [Hortaea werneckii EXF-2000]KAI6836768.1 hypothetical protein KC350_g6218 [Hortaea werneckii]KAI6931901.1 hypothetical protein KC348_g7121 [Hortaea werneckii]KAI6935970.1 hypothetical protein KC341_g6549 [Hortaea werneckii]
MDYVPLPKTGRLWKGKVDFLRPFKGGPAAAGDSGDHVTPLYDPYLHRQQDEEPDLKNLNVALAALIDIFPDIEPEVFREMLLSVSEESRVEIVTEQLLKRDAKWIRGRYRAPDATRQDKRAVATPTTLPSLAVEEAFRSESYKRAVKQVCYQEFRSLSHSSIKAVLAEHNHSYTLSRPVLLQLTTKSWRYTLSNLLTRRSTSWQQASEHPYVVRHPGQSVDSQTSAVRRTGNADLDHEIWMSLVQPESHRQQQAQLEADRSLANQLAESEAEEIGALFDCECCYSSVNFEQMAFCDIDLHQLCHDCVRRTIAEALYGQGWARAADLHKSALRCFALEDCQGCIPRKSTRLALSRNEDGKAAWEEFQARLTNDALIKSGIRLQRCPFCTYAEADEIPALNLRDWRDFWAQVARNSAPMVQFTFVLLLVCMTLFTVPLLVLAMTTWVLVHFYPPAGAILNESWTRVYKQRQGSKFKCGNPHCLRTSCVHCNALWRDPHTCFESEKTSLRTAIESSATAAVKRTCPRCMLSFVKSSGCNKLVCNCGYTMCYICRQEVTSREGYAHFCQHFRPNGGRCSECERCDLYGDEDEEAAIREAVGVAERAWRDKEHGNVDAQATELMVEALIGRSRYTKWWQQYLDGIVDALAR